MFVNYSTIFIIIIMAQSGDYMYGKTVKLRKMNWKSNETFIHGG